jgi:hypothetical protein
LTGLDRIALLPSQHFAAAHMIGITDRLVIAQNKVIVIFTR